MACEALIDVPTKRSSAPAAPERETDEEASKVAPKSNLQYKEANQRLIKELGNGKAAPQGYEALEKVQKHQGRSKQQEEIKKLPQESERAYEALEKFQKD